MARSRYQAQVASQGCLLRHYHTFLSALSWTHLMLSHGWELLGCIPCLRFRYKSTAYKTRKSPGLQPLFLDATTEGPTSPLRWLKMFPHTSGRADGGGGPQRLSRCPSWIGLLGHGDGLRSAVKNQGVSSFPRATPGPCPAPSPQASIPPGTSSLCSLRASFGPRVTCRELWPPSKFSIWTQR